MHSPRRPSRQIPLEARRQHLEAWARSGLPGKRYAAQHGLSKSALYAWRKRLNGPAAADDAAPIQNTRLVAIAVQQQPTFELRLRSGHLLCFPEGVATEAVAALLRALEAP